MQPRTCFVPPRRGRPSSCRPDMRCWLFQIVYGARLLGTLLSPPLSATRACRCYAAGLLCQMEVCG
jgi:hypothetical protein